MILKIISLFALAATIVPSVLYFAEATDHRAVNWLALAGTVVWFASTPWWMGRELPVDANEVEI